MTIDFKGAHYPKAVIDHGILNLRPSELALFQSLVAKHEDRPVPKQHLDPVATFGAKHND